MYSKTNMRVCVRMCVCVPQRLVAGVLVRGADSSGTPILQELDPLLFIIRAAGLNTHRKTAALQTCPIIILLLYCVLS